MYPIIETKIIKNPFGNRQFIANICLGKDGRKITRYADGYYYISKDETKITKRRYKENNKIKSSF